MRELSQIVAWGVPFPKAAFVIPAQAGIHRAAGTEAFGACGTMDPGLRRDDEYRQGQRFNGTVTGWPV
ncbi:hypothetical protein ASG37_13735 [Sphingomonas sp. Leaf407]|uniref:hypothetical protein n=1 Tax=unclassified Sphingomonas TaxID=196159 RepID=UPI0006FF264D|nr:MULTISPECIES: hypothetical protein [unclassified Sphingomonas]KQN36637.1 hypothetical protein ASE97_12990 [Sphingomonas sp. Leaf42]KQT27259.1 hypothetical protein ASG37_13735 [Sphingomonas sp. Leaf407]